MAVEVQIADFGGTDQEVGVAVGVDELGEADAGGGVGGEMGVENPILRIGSAGAIGIRDDGPEIGFGFGV